MKTDGLAQRCRVQVGPGRPEATHPTPERGLGCHQDGDQPAPPSSPPPDQGQHLYVISWVSQEVGPFQGTNTSLGRRPGTRGWAAVGWVVMKGGGEW